MSWTAVIPTRGDRHRYLLPMVDILGPRNTIIIHTDPSSCHVPGASNLDDYGPVNIHRWWNVGIAASPDDYVAVLNDDLIIEHLTVPALADALDSTGATLAHHGTETRVAGWCWMIDRRHKVVPDERFRWWYGDNDLAGRALRDGRGIAIAKHGAPTHVHPNGHTTQDPHLQYLAEQDRRTYDHAHPSVH